MSPRPGPLVVITDRFPYGVNEAFFAAEFAALRESGAALIVVPVRPGSTAVHGDAAGHADITIREGLLSIACLSAVLRWAARRPLRLLRVVGTACGDLRPRILARNLVAIPKGCRLASICTDLGARHLHALWAAVPASIGLYAHQLTGIPWSFTAHRYDIIQDNLLGRKLEAAAFARAIARDGLDGLVSRAGEIHRSRIHVLMMGVRIPEQPRRSAAARGAGTRVLCAAGLIPRKRHADLIAAVALVPGIELVLAGSGPLDGELRMKAAQAGIAERVRFLGQVSHDRLERMVADGEFDVGALVSDSEGVSVAVMELMAAGIPVVASRVGGMAELISPANGRLVDVGDVAAIAGALGELASDAELRRRLGEAARAEVFERHDALRAAAGLLALVDRHSRMGSAP